MLSYYPCRYISVILSVVLLDVGEKNGVEESHVVQKILRLRNSPSIVGDAGRIAPLRMT